MGVLCKTVSVCKGYTFHEEITLVDADTAFDNVLPSESQYKYTRAELIAETKQVRLVGHKCVCPACGQSTPAYKHYVKGFMPGKKVTRSKAKAWKRYLDSMFCEDFVIELFEPLGGTDKFKCVHCGKPSGKSDEELCISISALEQKITIEYPIETLADALSIEWVHDVFVVELPLTERLVFDFEKGETSLELRDCNEELLASEKIIDGYSERILLSPLIRVVTYNKDVKEYLRDAFGRIWGKIIPFDYERLNVIHLSLMVSFVGYDSRSFYYGLPSVLSQICSDEELKSIKARMHNSENLISMYDESSLPGLKSVKRIMFSENNLLFFYIKELEKLWECTGKNPNNFCNIISQRNILITLKFLHDFPGAFEFYRDFCGIGKTNILKRFLKDFPEELNEYAVMYASLSEHKKQVLKEAWKHDCALVIHSGRDSVKDYFSRVVSLSKLSGLYNHCVGGYDFAPLRDNESFRRAAKELNNCLDSMYFDNPIIGILNGNHYIGAIEVDVDRRSVLQVYLENNKAIETNPDALRAFLRWCQLNDFTSGYDNSALADCG